MTDTDKAAIRYAHAHGHIPRQDHRGMLLAALDDAERERDELRALLIEVRNCRYDGSDRVWYEGLIVRIDAALGGGR